MSPGPAPVQRVPNTTHHSAHPSWCTRNAAHASPHAGHPIFHPERQAGTGGTIVFAGPEDPIADRMGQQAVASPTDRSRLYQARSILALTPDLDHPYMIRRIQEEGGDPDLPFRGDP